MSIIHDRSLKLLSDGISPKKKGKFRNKIKQAEKSFFAFCCLKVPDFYKPEREYLKKLYREMQAFHAMDFRTESERENYDRFLQ